MVTLRMPPTDQKQVVKARKNYDRLVRDLDAMRREVQVADARRLAAVAADEAAIVKAMKAGAADPELTASGAERAASDLRRRVELLAKAVESAKEDVIAAVEVNMTELTRTADRRLDAARERYLAVLGELTVIHDGELEEAEDACRLLNQWPTGKASSGVRYLAGLPAGANGEPITVGAALGALRERVLPTRAPATPGPAYIGKRLHFADGTNPPLIESMTGPTVA